MTGEQHEEQIAAERAALREVIDRARRLSAAGDREALRALAGAALQRLAARDSGALTGGQLRGRIADLTGELDELYDAAFPVRDASDPADVLDAPWPTRRRTALLGAITGQPGSPAPRCDDLVDPATDAGDARLLQLLLRTPAGRLLPGAAIRALDALHKQGKLDAETAELGLLADSHLASWIFRAAAPAGPPAPPPSCAAAVRPVLDDLLWRLTSPGAPPCPLPLNVVPAGLRFVRRALDWPPGHPEAARFGSALLSPQELAGLTGYLQDRPMGERERAFGFRLRAGDAGALLPVLGLAAAGPLFALAEQASGTVSGEDYAAILAAAQKAGEQDARRLLALRPNELVSAALGWNRAAAARRVAHNALDGIAAYGLLPLADGETVTDRYAALREVARRGPKLGPNRRHSHAGAIATALEHLALVAGFADATRLEWACEARIAADAPPEVRAGDYSAAVVLEDGEPVIAVTGRAGRRARSVPAAVRADPGYAQLRAYQERLRDQARRMRGGLIERLVATEGTLQPDELARLRGLPCGGPLLSALIWQDRAGVTGLLDQVDSCGPLTAVHPFTLYQRRELSHWQAEVVHHRIRQPVKQAFRELYLLTDAERAAGKASARFDGHLVDGRIATQLLSARGWTLHHEYADYQATRPAGPDLTAALTCQFRGYFGGGEAVTGPVRFLAGRTPVPLDTVAPVVFSEVMRDLDLMVSVAGTQGGAVRADSRAQLLTALIGELGLDRVSVDGRSAVVRGSRATYRVHLTSGSIHLEPGGYLCIVPKSFGHSSHRQLFLPFADEDHMTSVILSKVLLLSEDEKITDRSILAQLRGVPGCDP